MYDFVSIGNISVDTFFQGESLTHDKERFNLAIGGKYFVDKVVQTLGGGGANVAIGVAKHKLKSAVLGTIGNNSFKKMILESLNEYNVSTELCTFEDNFTNVSSILLTPDGEKTVIHYSSPHQHILKDVNYRIFKTKLVYLGNVPEISIYERMRFLEKLQFMKIKCIVNMGIRDCRLPKSALTFFLDHVNVLIVNGHEFAELVKAPYVDIHFKEDVVSWYLPNMKKKLVIVTEGKHGSYAYHNGNVYHQPVFPIEKIVDETGAGDAYTAGFIAGYFKSDDIRLAMKEGTQYALKILGKIGAN